MKKNKILIIGELTPFVDDFLKSGLHRRHEFVEAKEEEGVDEQLGLQYFSLIVLVASTNNQKMIERVLDEMISVQNEKVSLGLALDEATFDKFRGRNVKFFQRRKGTERKEISPKHSTKEFFERAHKILDR